MANVLLVIAPDRFQEVEYGETKRALEEAGHSTTTTSLQETAHDKQGNPLEVQMLLKDVNPDNYDAISFIGGPGASVFFENQGALDLAKDFNNAGKPTTAICIAPSILANAGLLNGKKATCFPTEAENLQKHGANYTGNPTEQDGTILTANGPDAAPQFGQQLAQMLV